MRVRNVWQLPFIDHIFVNRILHNWKAMIINLVRQIPYLGALLSKKIILDKINWAVEKDAKDFLEQRQQQRQLIRIQNKYKQFQTQKQTVGLNPQHQEFLLRLQNIQRNFETIAQTTTQKALPSPSQVSKTALSTQLENEVINKCIDLYHGPQNSQGFIVASNSDSVLLTCRAYQGFSKDKLGIEKPEIIISTTAHDDYIKFSLDLNIKFISIPVDPNSQTANISAIESAINENTILIVATAPSLTGNIDPIESLAEIATKRKVGLHIDTTANGILLPFIAEIDSTISYNDFSLVGVTSLSLNISNKDGKSDGPSVVLFRSNELSGSLRKTDTSSWTRGSIPRPDSDIAKAWASIVYRDSTQSIEIARNMLTVKDVLLKGIKVIDEIELIGEPKLGTIAIQSRALNSHLIAKKMIEKGWPLHYISNPKGFSLHLTMENVPTINCDTFLEQLSETTKYVKSNPSEQFMGNLILHGMVSKHSKPNTQSFMLDQLEGEYPVPNLTSKAAAASA